MVYIYIYIRIIWKYFCDILGLYPINEPWWATNDTLCRSSTLPVDSPTSSFPQMNLIKIDPSGDSQREMVGWLQWPGRLDVIMVLWFMFTYIWMEICLLLTVSSWFSRVVLPSFLHMLCARFPLWLYAFRTPSVKDELFTRVWNSKTMFLTPPHTHTHTTLHKRNGLIWPVPPFCLLLGFSGWQGF